MPYAQISLSALTAALLQRLQDVAGVFTTAAEAKIYITEALRVLNAQTAIWNADYQFDFHPGDRWKSLNVSGSPRQRTVTDAAIETQMEYMLMEPPTGQMWTGTGQFNITALSNALLYRRDELLLLSAANMVNLTTLTSPTVGVRTLLPDSTLGLRRVRWVPTTGTPYALDREDRISVNAYGDLLTVAPPESYLLTSNPPLSFDISSIPDVPGAWDLLTYNSGYGFTPPTPSPLNLPDDWSWVAMYGALADCLSNSPEAVDPARAKYCLDRHQRGMKAMMSLPWLLSATVASSPVDTPSFREMDAYAQNWEQEWPAIDPQIVVGGMDFVALAPFNPPTVSPAVPVNVSSILTLVGNAPIPSAPNAAIQLSPDGIEAVLNYSQHIAMFKSAGADFAATIPLYEQFESYCRSINSNYAALGVYRPEMILEGFRGEQIDPRFSPEADDGK